MAAQLRQICAIGRNPNVMVQVIPLEVGTHAGLSGAFLLLEFPRAASIVHLEHLQSSVFLDREDDITPYVAAVDTLRRAAFDPVRSIERIEHIATDFES